MLFKLASEGVHNAQLIMLRAHHHFHTITTLVTFFALIVNEDLKLPIGAVLVLSFE
jgi:hypothetical protein